MPRKKPIPCRNVSYTVTASAATTTTTTIGSSLINNNQQTTENPKNIQYNQLAPTVNHSQIKKNAARIVAKLKSTCRPCTKQVHLEDSVLVRSTLATAQNPQLLSDLLTQITQIKEDVDETRNWALDRVYKVILSRCDRISQIQSLKIKLHEKQQLIDDKEWVEDIQMKCNAMATRIKIADHRSATAREAANELSADLKKIKTDRDASNSSASQARRKCAEIKQREKKTIKKISDIEKRTYKIQEDIQEAKNKRLQLEQQLLELKQTLEEYEAEEKHETELKKQSQSQVEEEITRKNISEAMLSKMLPDMQQKIENELQHSKDEKERLQQEISRRMTLKSVDQGDLPDILFSSKEDISTIWELCALKTPEFYEVETQCRLCMICSEKESNALFLPCTHQVLCFDCAENLCTDEVARCPCCDEGISQSILVRNN